MNTVSPTYRPGLEDVAAGETGLCLIEEGGAGLCYRGYQIEDLATQASFEEVAYLLLFGILPTSHKLKDFSQTLQAQRAIPDSLYAMLSLVPPRSSLMDRLRTAVSFLGMVDSEASDNSQDATLRKSVRLLAQTPTIMMAAHLGKGFMNRPQPRRTELVGTPRLGPMPSFPKHWSPLRNSGHLPNG